MSRLYRLMIAKLINKLQGPTQHRPSERKEKIFKLTKILHKKALRFLLVLACESNNECAVYFFWFWHCPSAFLWNAKIIFADGIIVRGHFDGSFISCVPKKTFGKFEVTTQRSITETILDMTNEIQNCRFPLYALNELCTAEI